MKKKEALKLLSNMAVRAVTSDVDVVMFKNGEVSEVEFDLVSESVGATLVYTVELLKNQIDSEDDFDIDKELKKLYKAILEYHYFCLDDDDAKSA